MRTPKLKAPTMMTQRSNRAAAAFIELASGRSEAFPPASQPTILSIFEPFAFH